MSFFYANGGILAFPSPDRLQESLDVLTGLLDSVGLQTNLKIGGYGMPAMSHV